MKKIILTGFEPFGEYKFNPSKDLVEHYNGKVFGEKQIIGIVLPCTYLGAFEKIEKVLTRQKPHAIVSVGLASRVQGIRIETKFQNLMCGKYPDANGFNPVDMEIIPHSERFFWSEGLANAIFLNKLRSENIPVEISNDAEGFICNSLGYLTSKKIKENKLPIRNMFLHIPWTDDYKSKITLEPGKIYMPKETLHKAIELIIKSI